MKLKPAGQNILPAFSMKIRELLTSYLNYQMITFDGRTEICIFSKISE